MAQPLVSPSRLLLAVKAALAAAIAWYLAPFVPFAASEYSYYAPLGVLVSMYPTVFDSARSGAQALVGLAVGIGLGIGAVQVVYLGAPGIVAIALVVGVGIFIGGLRFLGIGRDWVSIAGLFVLLLSNGDASNFSLSYLITMAFGVVVGVLVQWIAVPPIYLSEARAQLLELRRALSSCLLEAGVAMDDERNGTVALSQAVDHLEVTATSITDQILEARRSERANPRARRRHTERANLDDEFEALERAIVSVRAVADFAEQLRPGVRPPSSPVGRDLLVEAVRRCPLLVDGADSGSNSNPTPRELAARAEQSLDEYFSKTQRGGHEDSRTVESENAVAACLRRVVNVLGQPA